MSEPKRNKRRGKIEKEELVEKKIEKVVIIYLIDDVSFHVDYG
jgi:hypothetical protein